MKTLFKIGGLLLLMFTIFSGCKKQDPLLSENTKSYALSSTSTGDNYRLTILYPEQFDTAVQYHMVCLLDGDWYFNEMAEIIGEQYPSTVVLAGISYESGNNRSKDFTFPADEMFPNSGGAKAFIQFINLELLPYIENDLSINISESTLAGHSLGGYFALYQLLQQDFTNPFDNIIAASPSLFWHEAYILDLEESYNSTNDTLDKKLVITMGDLEGVTMNTLYDAMVEKIESRNYSGLQFSYKRFKNISHNNNPIISFEEGLSFILK